MYVHTYTITASSSNIYKIFVENKTLFYINIDNNQNPKNSFNFLNYFIKI